MVQYIALFRGVNVGGNRKLPMAALRTKLEGLGYRDVRTLLASGNLVFEAKRAKTAVLEKKLEVDLERAMGFTTDTMVRDPEEWDAIIDANPFVAEAAANPSRVLVSMLKSKPTSAAIKAVLAGNQGPELIEVFGREIYLVYPDGAGNSKLNLKPLGSGTARNWNTMLKLRAMVSSR